MTYIALIIITLLLGLGTQAYIQHQYSKYARVPISTGKTGAQAAREMLDANGLRDVQITQISGNLTDNYNPKTNVLNLSQDVYNGATVAANAVACHEAGHAVQHAQNYAPARFRMAIVPVVNFASNVWVIVLMAGFILNLMNLVWVAIFLFAFAVVFQIVTLPVEFDASHRALANIDSFGLPEAETTGAHKVLYAAALTYVAAALSSILQLLYYISIAKRD